MPTPGLGIKSEPLANPFTCTLRTTKRKFASTYSDLPHTLILGQPWLFHHNPKIEWRSGDINRWGKDCHKSCFMSLAQGKDEAEINLFSVNPTTESEYPDLNLVPPCYHQLNKVFSKTKALSLPPHHSYDCAVDLIPKGRLYSFSGLEKEAMTEYLTTSLKVGLIRPSSSPAGVGFFFVDKRDGSLRPCIDYSPLNDITKKNRYPLSHMSSVFDQIQQAEHGGRGCTEFRSG